ncbi:rhodanese-like domain-containing protein [Alcanivorax sp. 1008]|uniref:rhodanese-like domain-containing protein n=1 Tax=Alcanivorax sp. 1008 TaxID=2816853 RepID=UPI001D98ECB4|nr:rhodanese-like domain-containing protein [Alcanivorax sp. 1008]MCC1495800.1 rhodanese-like domain-containing protein [Alcanivorax sp. 1008]
MDRLLEFVINHYILVSAFFILWAVFFSLESKRGGKTVSPQQATNLVNREDARVVDLRDADEFRQGHVAGSINIPMSQFAERIAELDKFKDKPVILVCKMGTSASLAGRQLSARGFGNVVRMQGGIQGWRADNLPVVKA